MLLVNMESILRLVHDATTSAAMRMSVLAPAQLVRGLLGGRLVVIRLNRAEGSLLAKSSSLLMGVSLPGNLVSSASEVLLHDGASRLGGVRRHLLAHLCGHSQQEDRTEPVADLLVERSLRPASVMMMEVEL